MERTELVRVMELRQGASVKRYHTERTIGAQSVAEHSHGVAMLLWQFFPQHANSNVLFACLTHDLPEGFTGDMPAPIKWGNPDLNDHLDRIEEERAKYLGIKVSLSDEEYFALKCCDYLEGILYCYEQITSGNRHMVKPFQNFLNWFSDKKVPTAVEGILFQVKFSIISETFK